MDEKRTEISELGEFALIDKLTNGVKLYKKETIKGIGDDATVIRQGDNVLLVSSDMMMEGIHFDLSYYPIQHLGYKLVVTNVSDIAAMNAIPTQILVNIGVSNRFSIEALESLYEGINAACKDYKIDFVGGDTSSSASGLILSATILGKTKEEMVTYRSGAKVNDILCVSGDLGGAYIGLQILEREKQEFLTNPEMQPNLNKYEYVVGRQLKPKARTDLVYEFKELGLVPTSMIDISDGLASEIFHIAKSSNVGIKIFEEHLPIDKETFETSAEFSIDPLTAALNGGEDYELLFTIQQADFDKLKKHADIHFIGHIDKPGTGKILVTRNGAGVELQAQGWNHFSSQDQSSG